ncbi:tripartite tricarboxylate transporter substrate binding protein [Bordetella tumbae]|uniref:Bug family tripartite tricarboxylate transporter substrate binding protein n=1 Tax=Bordetella tumbae TaxID=1649139 RepID=UPI0039F0A93C
MSKVHRRSLTALAAVCMLASVSVSALASDWPGSKPVNIIVPSAAGGAADLTARTVARYLSQKAGVDNVVVQDKPGAGGVIGTAAVKNAAPDGYTFLLSTNSTQSANRYLYKTLPYDADKDFVNVGMIGTFQTVAVVSPDSKINTLRELVEQARSEPGKVFFGYYSSSSQVPPNLLKQYAKIDIAGAAYKNVTQILTDLRSGLIQFAFVDYLTAKGQIEGGNLKPIAVTGTERNPHLPNIETTTSVYPGFIVEGWMGISAPAGTPQAVVEKMSTYLKHALVDPEMVKQLSDLGLQPQAMGVAEFGKYIDGDIQRWAKWVETAQIKAQ